uniref:Uncharacterized protein n=1 Tax=Globisporangium ultimum (strain ATCC 200006 / CBS 805.95 / DAOM BR144) TaxID=431595 RepID=K3WLB2_GLOUD
MSDPFASLDPIQKPKTAAERVLTAPTYSQPPPGAPVAVAPFGAGGMGMGSMGMGGMDHGMAPGMGMGQGMGMQMNMGGMAPGMGMHPGMGGGLGMGQPQLNPFQQQQYQQQQQPVMYDNIKNLLQQKPKGAFEDSASMDFLEHLGSGGSGLGGSAKTNSGSMPPALSTTVRAPEPVAAVDPFGGGFGSSPVSPSSMDDGGFSIFETGGGGSSGSAPTTSPSSASSGSKSSALADRLANGRRKTQEAQRSQLAFNANSFANSGGAAAVPKISLKEMAGQKPSFSTDSVTLDDFASGATATGSFGSSGGNADPFGSDFGSTNKPSSRSNSGSNTRTESGPKLVDENDNTFW